MSAVKLNHEGVDVVSLRASQTGSNEIHFTSKHNLFNSDLQYIFAVTDLNVDCSALPIFPPNTNDTLFTIKKREVVLGVLQDVTFNGDLQRLQILPAGRKYFDVSTFLTDASATAYTFSKQQDVAGIGNAPNYLVDPNHYAELVGGPQNYLNIGFDAGGRIMIEGVSAFWNHFVIQFSAYAVRLFHLQDVVAPDNTLSLTFVGGAIITGTNNNQYPLGALYIDANNVRAGGILTKHTIVGKHSVLKFLDHRLFLTVETHLPTLRNMRVHNGVEETDASLIRVPFLNMAESTIFCKDKTIVDEVSLTTKSYVGKMSFVKKTNPIAKYNTLTSSFEQRIFRFFVFCTYNIYAAGGFSQSKIAVPFSPNGEWDLSVRFISKI